MSQMPAPNAKSPLLPLPFGAAEFLESAAAAIARLDHAVTGHPLRPAWEYRTRLEAIRRQAHAEGLILDPWQLAALHLDVKLCLEAGQTLQERGALLLTAQHALRLERWYVGPDARQKAAIQRAASHLKRAGDRCSPLTGAALAAHEWLAKANECAPLGVALSIHWHQAGLTSGAWPLLSGVLAFRGSALDAVETWMPRFWGALADEAALGFDVLRLVERQWRFAREATEARRRDSHAAKAIDLLAATPVLSAYALAERVGVSVNTATNLLESFMAEGLITEVTGRRKRRLYGLPHLAPLRQAIAPPRYPVPGRKRGRPPKTPVETKAPRDVLYAEALGPEARKSFDTDARYAPLPKIEFDFSELDQILDAAEKASAHSKEILDKLNRSYNKLSAEYSEE